MTRIFSKTYDGESLIDLARDVDEAFDGQINSIIYSVPVDEYGIHKGSFKVTIEWEDD